MRDCEKNHYEFKSQLAADCKTQQAALCSLLCGLRAGREQKEI
jgi:hypothetical protein